MRIEEFSVIDLFCGVGGLTHGFVKEKFDVVAGIDSDETCRFAFEENNGAKFIHKDVTKLTGEELNLSYRTDKRKILVGCAPCQPFSIYNRKGVKKSERPKSDEKWRLLYSFADLIEETSPEIISMENVPQLLNFNNGKVFKDFVKRLKKEGYFISYSVVNAQDYGVPQRRKRLVLFGSKHGKIDLVNKTIEEEKYITVRNAIGDLPEVEDGVPHPSDKLHRSRKLTALNKRRIQATKEGGNWKDWDESLLLECHKKETGKDFKSVYGRMKWDDVAPTMTTYCIGLSNGRFGHPVQDRAITLREAALLQSFPSSYKFIPPDSDMPNTILARHIGNAVPVELGVIIAKSIKNHIEQIERS